MGRIVNALIEHSLPLEEILQLPLRFQTSRNQNIAGIWKWSKDNLNKEIITNLWSLKLDYFIKHSWSTEDLVILEKDKMTLHFYKPNILTFNNLLSWYSYNENENSKREFNQLVKEISSFLKTVDTIIVPDLSSVDFFDEDVDLTVNSYRLKAKGDSMNAIELE